MRLDQLLGEQNVRSAEGWNQLTDNYLDFNESHVTDSLTIGRGV